jgi:hypothetical protein
MFAPEAVVRKRFSAAHTPKSLAKAATSTPATLLKFKEQQYNRRLQNGQYVCTLTSYTGAAADTIPQSQRTPPSTISRRKPTGTGESLHPFPPRRHQPQTLRKRYN